MTGKVRSNPVLRGAGLCLLASALVLGACTKKEDRIKFEGFYFPANAKAIDKKANRAEFVVTVEKAFQSIEAAREAGGYEGIRYCIKNYGTSRIDWAVGPKDEVMPGEKGRMTFQGTCRP